MIVTYNWLKEFVDFEMSPDELAHRLTMAGLEVDSMDFIGEGLDSVVTARLVSVDKHPDADKLTVCQVDYGQDTVQVVCGATNHKAGDVVALATVGTVLPGDFKIKKSKIRGMESFGMLCSEKELGLAQDSDGIMILSPDCEPGQPVFEVLGLKDVRYELGLTPNRPDCLSVLGVAREVSAMCGRSLNVNLPPLSEGDESTRALTSVTIEDAEYCPRYAARLIRGVKVGPSPDWLVRKLESVGQRSVNNVVDVTNFILMELGHPLHAFDYQRLAEGRIVVKRAASKEQFTTLDSVSRSLEKSDLVICDGQGAVALAGVMGGENSEVVAETVDILLESAYFNPLAIRRTSKRLSLRSEASHRFERGADIAMVPVALDKAAALIVQVAGGVVCKGMIDEFPRPLAERKVTLAVQRVNEILGLKLGMDDIQAHLLSIGLEVQPVEEKDIDRLVVTIPSFRPDLERDIDLVEEVARLNGYDNIPVTMPAGRMLCHLPPQHLREVKRLRDVMVAAGFNETVNYSFVAPEAWDRLELSDDDPRREPVKILNPLTEDQSVMRTSLVPSLLECVTRNVAYQNSDLHLFELRPVFLTHTDDVLPIEKWRLCAVLCGRREQEGWRQNDEKVDFYDLKGVVEQILDSFNVAKVTWDGSSSENFLHPGKSCTLKQKKTVLGTLGEVHPKVLAAFDIDQPVYLLDLDFEQLLMAAGGHGGFSALSRFPQVARDSAFLVDEDIPFSEISEVLNRSTGKLVEDIVLFDVYRGKGIPEGKKSLAIRVRYRSDDRTLKDEEIQKAHDKIVKALIAKLGAEIR
ncbi:phenylalanyl-tRNA synthetase, beta subunit [Syntrophotalea carbinolica DSM 2380]|uniref:Phenylalanine--tRNA ligase beta subunit n=1 Tax=Syntrophotalea carbinolica (strain DSM 2380 / NBRC 103641 / GraBd1) TaxID=338963 RepID=SYFB_SYNC1|nr:phenylalanine--tRNA ligase subunit beta [Syntrophotalea carbinolica]Q3A4N8.1 RecName: Full=Phenylalanine--tRNA ligase beta subunit; AltName: Full=Phenylalanyl-tRNA synthetase beta subunit; Short=PheRS [Syntrophotalea carbinolica DSM 2380]ABA88669.1 phenylalanyl-tRNA synthetase, beta subunit [Syntrophotalea carbinolica DSM 2380]